MEWGRDAGPMFLHQHYWIMLFDFPYAGQISTNLDVKQTPLMQELQLLIDHVRIFFNWEVSTGSIIVIFGIDAIKEISLND